MEHVLHTLAFSAGDPTWFQALLLVIGILGIVVLFAWWVARNK